MIGSMSVRDQLLHHPFRTAVEAGDLDAMTAALTEDVRLHSPVAFQPFEGKQVVREVFRNLLEVFEGFHYVDELAGADTHALVFRAFVGGRQVEGLDHLRFAPDGRIQDLTVMVRPLSAAVALAEAMGPRVAGLKG
jgi:hypothetical protein